MNFEKSRKGLGDLYEEDFKVNILGQSQSPETEAAEQEISQMLNAIYFELDQLSNFHFTPKPIN